MGRVVVLGERSRVAGFALSGADVIAVEDADEARRAWDGLDDEVSVLVLTPRAATALADLLSADYPEPGRPLPVVMPEATW